MPNLEQNSWLAKLGISHFSTPSPDNDEQTSTAPAAARGGGVVDAVVNTVRGVVGAGPSDEQLDEVKENLENGERAMKLAAAAGVFAEKDVEKLSQAGETLGKLAGGIDKALKIRGDLRAALEIRDALKVLNDPNNLQPGSRVAAKAFGQLFEGAGRFAEKLPPPANAYAPILKGCVNFFSDIQRLNDPETSPNEGPQMREVLREL